MNVIDLPAEVAESCLEMAIALSHAAQGHGELLHAAAFVHRCYVRAVTPAASERAHDLRWRRFIRALEAYLHHCSGAGVCAPARLREIVMENADLLERDSALAS